MVLVNKQDSVSLNIPAIHSSIINNLKITEPFYPGEIKTWDIEVDDWFYGPVLGLNLGC